MAKCRAEKCDNLQMNGRKFCGKCLTKRQHLPQSLICIVKGCGEDKIYAKHHCRIHYNEATRARRTLVAKLPCVEEGCGGKRLGTRLRCSPCHEIHYAERRNNPLPKKPKYQLNDNQKWVCQQLLEKCGIIRAKYYG